MFEMLTGAAPFAGDSALGALLARMKAPPPDVRSLRRDCPRWLARLVRRLLEREPANRYPSAHAVLHDLRRQRAILMPSRVGKIAAVAVAAIAIAMGVIAGARVWREQNGFHHFVAAPNGVISAVNGRGQKLWELRGYDPELVDKFAFLRHGHGGEPEIAAILHAPGDVRFDVVHTLSFLDPDTGKVRKRVSLPSDANNFRDLPRRYAPGSIFAVDLDDDGREEVIVTLIHYPEWPSYTVLYEPSVGRARLIFSATGHHHFAGAADVDGDGRKDLLFRGIHNGYGWYNAAAAVRLEPPVNSFEAPENAATSPDISQSQMDALVLWYTYLPRGTQPASVKAIIDAHSVRFAYSDGRTIALGLDGLPLTADHRVIRAAAHKDAFIRLRTSERLTAAGSFDAAIAEGTAALKAAQTSGDALLVEAVQVRRGRFLVRASRLADAERHYDEIRRGSDRPSDVAMEAAETFHLAGDLERALRWYKLALSYAQQNGPGRSRHELIEGFVLAAAELGKWDEAHAEVVRFEDAYRLAYGDWPAYYREFTRWRFGKGMPDVSGVEVPASAIDILRYWRLEFALSRGAAPRELLLRIDPDFEAQSPTRSALLSLHAELLHRLGRTAEARPLIVRAVELARVDSEQTTIARAHKALVEERYRRIMGVR
jgi:tetratricopeptide (TPR) repeat protein